MISRIFFADEDPLLVHPQPARLQPSQNYVSKQKKRQQVQEKDRDEIPHSSIPVVEIIPVDPRKRPTKVPPTQLTRFPLTTPPVIEEVTTTTTKVEEAEEEEVEYEYIEDEDEEKVEEDNNKLRNETSTTEDAPQIINIEEVFGVSSPSEPKTETSVEIVHKGTPSELSPSSEETLESSTAKNDTYEYEYYYEDEDTTEVEGNSVQSTTTKQLVSSPTTTSTSTTTTKPVSGVTIFIFTSQF